MRVHDVGRSLLVAVSLPAALMCVVAVAPAQCAKQGSTHEQILRSHAIRAVIPDFPAEARAQKAHGVVVTQLGLNEQGIVMWVKVLQSPHPAINQAVIGAVRQWTFRPFRIEEEPACMAGKLTFYYIVEDNGRAYVRNPKRYG